MANKELLETIRKEIVSRIDKRHLSEQAKNELVSILSFTDTLESEKPMNQEGLEEEIVKVCNDFAFPLYGLDDEFGRELINKIARHFAQWGADHTPLPEDTVLFNKGVEEGKRLMMEEAVEVMVTSNLANNPIIYFDNAKKLGLKYGDKVRIIILKED